MLLVQVEFGNKKSILVDINKEFNPPLKLGKNAMRNRTEMAKDPKVADFQLTEIELLPKSAELLSLLEAHRGERHIIAIQNFPDPDAISSAIAQQLISKEFGIDVDIV